MRRLLRSPREYAFRAWQEVRNLALLTAPPGWKRGPLASPLAFLPNPQEVAAQLRGTALAAELTAVADSVLQHRFPLLGTTLETGSEIRWRRDYPRSVETDTRYFRRIPYLDLVRCGDHKSIWELNRHQHLVLLAQAGLLTREERYFEAAGAQIESWVRANPFQRGINWTSALEVGLRALSWMWVFHLVGDRVPEGFAEHLYRHGCHLAANLSYYFSPNTHLLGEAVALHALGLMFGEKDWERTGAAVARRQAELQVRADGSHLEQSSYYHLYALDMFLFHAILSRDCDAWRETLRRMAEYLRALLGPSRRLPFIGDDDGGRFFHPYGRRDQFACATLATCSVVLDQPEWWTCREDLFPQALWWLGPAVLEGPAGGEEAALDSRLFPDAGMAVMTSGLHHVMVDAGPFGPWGSGHSHSDTLSLVVRSAQEEILNDPGTYTYVGAGRDWFRGSAAHNTVRIDGLDQAAPSDPFRWTGQPEVRILKWVSAPGEDLLEAECRYAGFSHRRQVRFAKRPEASVVVTDEIHGPPGEHTVEQLWHPGEAVTPAGTREFRIGSRAVLTLGEDGEIAEDGWRSEAFGHRERAPIIRAVRRTQLPARLSAVLLLHG